ncbi:transcription-repair coupling factor, partial [Dissulfurirhabdus thermomarina]|nr:transcription-repair coupling factor [Dissulfurirhabdus thermomarina]
MPDPAGPLPLHLPAPGITPTVNTDRLLDHLLAGPSPPSRAVDVTGLAGSAPAWILSRLAGRLRRPVLWVTADPARAEQAAADLAFFTSAPVLPFPAPEALPFVPMMPAPEIAARRVGTLYQAATGEGFRVVIAPVQALLRRTLPPEVLLAEVEYVAAGEEADRDGLTAWLVARGYQRTRLVQAPGEFSVRGSLLDLFPPLHDRPIRLDFFGDQVEEIRAFDPLTQRTLHHLPEAVILPAAEVFLPGCREADLQAVQDRVVRVAGDRGWPARKVHELLQRIESCRLAEGSEILLPLLHPDP